MSELSHYEKTGYLHDDFKIFHLKDTSMRPIDFHYHDFHKILIFRKGNISYNVEGRTYDLIPGDIVFVPAGTVHRPVLHSSEIYERIIIYISRHYLDACHDSDDLSLCLKEAHQKKSHVLRIPALKTTQIARIIHDLEQSLDSREYANELYHKLLFLELMVQLNRAALSNRIEYLSTTASNHKMIHVIDYLNAHLTDDITIDFLAEHFYLSRYLQGRNRLYDRKLSDHEAPFAGKRSDRPGEIHHHRLLCLWFSQLFHLFPGIPQTFWLFSQRTAQLICLPVTFCALQGC